MSPAVVYNKYFVCENHFDDMSFTNNMKNRLKHNAIPTKNIFPIMSEALINEYNINVATWTGKKTYYQFRNNRLIYDFYFYLKFNYYFLIRDRYIL